MRKALATLGATIALAGGGSVVADQTQNPYTDKGTTLEIAASSTLPQAGMDKIIADKTQPRVVMEKWGGEVALGVKYEGIAAPGARPFLSKNVEWTQGAQKMEMVPLDASATMEDGGMEINIILDSAPSSNTFRFQLDNWESLDFFYQPPLTDAEVKEGASRPDNVVGSYAVYYKNHSNHVEGQTNYATGKAYHIFRPLVTDAKGNNVWADLHYSEGILSVTVPQDFLDSATYPVKVDPTFGETTHGASQLTGLTQGSPAFSSLVSSYVASLGDTINNYSYWGNCGSVPACTGSPAPGFVAFSVIAGVVANQLHATTSIPTNATTDQLWTSSNISVSPVAGVQYSIGVSWSAVDNVAQNISIDFDAGTAPGRFNSTLLGFPGVGNNFSPTGTDSGRHYSMYATYTAGSQPVPTVQINGSVQINGPVKI